MDLELKGKRALITGSSRGLGFAAARQLALEGAGVAINGRSQGSLASALEQLKTEAGSPVFALAGDVSAPDQAQKLVDDAVNMLGGLDILITNCGGPPAAPFETLDDAAWQQATEMSFLSHVRLIRAALPHLTASDAGSVLAVTSFTVKQPLENLILSNSVRLSTIGLVKSLSIELGPKGIRFNAILPGWTKTERVTELMQARAEARGTDAQTETQIQSAEIPLGRMGKPDEFGKTAAFLVSPAASYITGVMLQVDGGVIRSIL